MQTHLAVRGRRGCALLAATVASCTALASARASDVCSRSSNSTKVLIGTGVGGAAVAVAGAATFWLTGPSRQLAGVASAATLLGASVALTSGLAALYDVAVPDRAKGEAPSSDPILTSEIGYRHVYDPQFAYRSFMYQAIDARWRSWRVSPSGWFALDDRNTRLRIEAGKRWRLHDWRPPFDEGASAVELVVAATRHAFDGDGFRLSTGELAVQGTLNLGDLARSLRGSFAELGVGSALQTTTYVPNAPPDTTSLLLLRTGFGVYLGSAADPRGDIEVFYDHRHDDFAGALLSSGRVSGVLGHFGVRARWFPSQLAPLGFAAEAQAGSAYVAGLSLLYRFIGSES